MAIIKNLFAKGTHRYIYPRKICASKISQYIYSMYHSNTFLIVRLFYIWACDTRRAIPAYQREELWHIKVTPCKIMVSCGIESISSSYLNVNYTMWWLLTIPGTKLSHFSQFLFESQIVLQLCDARTRIKKVLNYVTSNIMFIQATFFIHTYHILCNVSCTDSS